MLLRGLLLVLCLGVALGLSSSPAHQRVKRRRDIDDCPLCEYVYDPIHADVYNYEVMDSEVVGGCTTYYLNLTSQVWMDEDWSDWPVWWHYLTIHVPNGARSEEDAAFIYLSYSSNTNSPPNSNSDHIYQTADICAKHGVVTAALRQIPNQPITFVNDDSGRSRSEDDMIAWTWDSFIQEENETGNANPWWPARNPMCRGAVAAMDAMTDFMSDVDGSLLERFFVAGESKRGWTTWITGAIDERVVGMAPVVLSCLNMQENFQHYYQSFGGWPYYFWDYWNKGLMWWLNEPEMDALCDIIDPFVYRDWMEMPKLMISSASDEFFLIDDSHYFFDDLPGEKFIWILEDSGHGIGSSPLNEEYWDMMGTFSMSVFENSARPSIEWQRSVDNTGETGTIHVTCSEAPRSIEIYWADSIVPHRRDWRTSALNWTLTEPPPNGQPPRYVESGIKWTSEPVDDMGNAEYEATMAFPEEGYRAFYVKMIFDGPRGDDFYFTSEAHVIPDDFPYPPCETNDECQGWLL